MRQQFLQLLLQAFDARIDEEKGIRSECEKDSTLWHHAFGRVDGVDTGRYLVEQVFEEQGHLLDDAHKRNTAQMVELNELCQQHGIGKIGDSVVPALKHYIEQNTQTIQLLERLLISEIGDYIAALDCAGIQQAHNDQMQHELITRVQRVFTDVKQQTQPTANDESITAYGDGFYDGFLKGCEFGDERSKTETEEAAMSESEYAENVSVFAKGKGVSERIINIMVASGHSGFIDGANKQWVDNLSDEQMLAAAEDYAKRIRQEAKAGA